MKRVSFLPLIFFVIIYQTAFSQSGITSHVLPAGYSYTQLRLKNCIATDALNNVYVGFRTIGIGKYTPSTQTWVMYDTANTGLSSNEVTAIQFDALGQMWVGTSKGLSMFDGINWTVYDSLNSGLSSNKIKTVNITSAGVWFGTNRGMNFFDGANWTSYTTANSGLVNDTVLSVDTYNGSDIYIGTQGGLSHYNGTTWINYTTFNSVLPDNRIGGVKCVSSNLVWLVSNSTLYQLIGNTIMDEHCEYETPSEFSFFNQPVGLTVDTTKNIYFFKKPFTLVRVDTLAGIEYMIDSLWSVIDSSAFGPWLTKDNTGILWATGGRIPNSGYLYSFDENASTGFTSFDKNQNSWQRYLDINNVSTLISNRGSMFWDMNQSAGVSKYEVPKCSAKTPMFTSSLWIGGYDASGTLHVSGQCYNSNNEHDYNTGPLDTTNATTTPTVNATFNNIWKIDRNTVDDFKTNFLNGNVTNGSYPVAYELLSYPAIGTGNYTRDMSPYIDYNSDGNYNPYDGDYPLIKGDQQLYWIFNDMDTVNRETQGIPLGVEVRAYAYAFTCGQNVLGDSNAVLDYTTFYRYEITNRSNNSYDSVFVGLHNDMDLGNAADDHPGCDSVLNAAFCYNSTNHDNVYGYNPPMFNCQILEGPEPVPGDGQDNDHDGVIDEPGEKNMMSAFRPIWGAGSNLGYPQNALHYYDFMRARWRNGLHMTYGMYGEFGDSLTNYFFSGIPYSNTGWTPFSVSSIGGDVEFLMSSGPFHLAPGETKSIDFAYVFTWDSTAANGLTTSIARNTADLQRVKYWFDNNNYPSCLNTSAQNIEVKNADATIFPNPADDYLYVVYSGVAKARLEIYDITGRYITAKEIKSRDKINIRSLSSGLYVAKVIVGDDTVSKKFIKK